ncbi:MAG: hypothetical protein KC503_34590 [Myxococcales bacterium]|nr:hypothetical protein [Myxococcales bacterium]
MPRVSVTITITIAVALLTALLTAPGAARAESRAGWLKREARVATQAAETERAIRLWRAYSRIDRSTAVLKQLSRLLEGAGRAEEAALVLEEAIARGKGDASVQAQLSQLRRKRSSVAYRSRERDQRRETKLAKRAFAKGRKLGLSGKLRLGSRYLEAAVVLDPRLPGIYRVLGAIYIKMGRKKAGYSHLADYLRMRPGGVLANKARRMLRGRGVLGSVRAMSSYSCNLWVNGEWLGMRSPTKRLTLPEGTFVLTFSSPKFHVQKSYRVNVSAGETTTVRFDFGIIDVDLKPWGRIRANGLDLGLWPKLGLPAGTYNLFVQSHDGKRSGRARWTVQAGKSRRLTWKSLR